MEESRLSVIRENSIQDGLNVFRDHLASVYDKQHIPKDPSSRDNLNQDGKVRPLY